MKNYWIVENEKLDPESQRILNEFLTKKKNSYMSVHTIRGYSYVLQRFIIFTGKPITKLNSQDILDWINGCSGYKKNTINMMISAISSFINFCHKKNYIDRKVCVKSRWRNRLPEPIPRYREQEELARLRIAAESRSLRDRCLFEFMLSSGCRVSEVVGLDIKDMDMENRTAVVLGKGKKYRLVHFSERCAILLEKHIESHPKNNPALFLNRYGDRLGVKGVEYAMKKISEKAGLEKSLTPHQLRHSFSTGLANKGADIGFISIAIGHSRTDTTRIYARVLNEQLAASYKKCMG